MSKKAKAISPKSNVQGPKSGVVAADSQLSTLNSQLPDLPAGPWAEYLAAHPEERELQFTLIKQVREAIAEFRPAVNDLVQRNIDVAEMGRRIGIAITELEDRLPGKKLTEDFWRQMEAVFNVNTGQSITREMLVWFGRVARHHPEPITTIGEVRAVQQSLLLASGEVRFQLEAGRPPQIAHAPPSPVSLLMEQLNVTRLESAWNQLRGDAHYYPGGRMREDLREDLRDYLKPTIRILDALKLELGL